MKPAETLLEMHGVGLNLSGKNLLHDIDLTVLPGEVVTIIGPNGAGKTTLLRLALGLLQPSEGTVRQADGIAIGYMPQRLHLDPTFPLSVKRFLLLATKADPQRAQQQLAEVGASHLYQESLQSLSGGELQRVLLARALMRDPDLLVLDEPVQGVDVHGQVELYQLITGIRDQRRCAVLMVSHDLHLVMAATDQVLCLNKHICCSGSPEMVTNDPAYLELFGPLAVQHLALYAHDPGPRHTSCKNCPEEHHAG